MLFAPALIIMETVISMTRMIRLTLTAKHKYIVGGRGAGRE